MYVMAGDLLVLSEPQTSVYKGTLPARFKIEPWLHRVAKHRSIIVFFFDTETLAF